jgi:hypothetical protein
MAGRAGSDRAAHGKENPQESLCGRPCGRTRGISLRQLPTDHDYAARPANIRLINRRQSDLDRYPLYLTKGEEVLKSNTNININPG